jgi:hypothetical protein
MIVVRGVAVDRGSVRGHADHFDDEDVWLGVGVVDDDGPSLDDTAFPVPRPSVAPRIRWDGNVNLQLGVLHQRCSSVERWSVAFCVE